MKIVIVRHAPSLHNIGQVNASEYGDCEVPLSSDGFDMAERRGAWLYDYCPKLFSPLVALHYCSPFKRTRQTMNSLRWGARCRCVELGNNPNPMDKIKVYEDPRLREMSFGVNKTRADIEAEREMRKRHGWFYYQFENGESPAMVYDRVSGFLETMMRQVERKHATRVLIGGHGITNRVLVMRFMHLSVEEYASLDNPDNCGVITMTDEGMENPQFTMGRWSVSGLVLRPAA